MFDAKMFGKYYLHERLAVGGMAEIFKAKMYGVDGFEKNMVVKQILPQYSRNKDFIQMFIDEAKITVSLSHGNIVPVFELGEIKGIYYIAMEQVDGKSLGEVMDAGLDQDLRLSIPHALFICSEMLAGLDYAHRKTDDQDRPLGIVHRDISPQNILISYEGEVKIVDFGIARAATKVHETQAGVIKGKFGYMSPEQALGRDVDGRSDVFAAGILLFEMLTLERLFQGTTDGVTLDRVKRADVPTPSRTNPRLPPKLDAIVFKALARRPEDRYQTAGEMRQDVSRFLYSLAEEASAQSLSVYVKRLFASELAERLLAPPVQMPADALRAPEPLRAGPPVAARSNPEALFQPLPSGPGPAVADALPIGEDDELEDDFSYARAGRRTKWIVLLVVVGLLVAGGVLFGRDILRVFTTVGDVIDESASRLAQKKLGTLYIRSRPTGASVYFSNRKVGSTDMRIANIDPTKEYELVLTKEGFQPFSRKVLPSDWKQDEEKMELQVFKNFTADGLK
jgi:serine/threonine protein kinase